jgi:RNA polymerase sigma-70 factor (ECF subfamily)
MELTGVKMLPLKNKKSALQENLKDAQFTAAIKSYQNNMFRLSKSILRNDQDAMDAVGETILKAYSKLDSLRSFDSFKPWIMKIVVNESYIIAKKRAKIDYAAEVETGDTAYDTMSTDIGL